MLIIYEPTKRLCVCMDLLQCFFIDMISAVFCDILIEHVNDLLFQITVLRKNYRREAYHKTGADARAGTAKASIHLIKSRFLDTCSDIMRSSRIRCEKGVNLMVYVIVIAFIILMLMPSKGRKPKERQLARPWYDISYDDIIKYDMFDDD